MQPRVVVSTGRCGSTLLTSLLAMHPAVLSLSETFASMQPGAFPAGAIDAARFWRILSEPKETWTLAMRNRLDMPELLYPLDGGGRFSRTTGIPPLAAISLPALSDDPDGLLDEVEALVREFPTAPIDAHYRRLFEALALRLGRDVWVERSGGSLNFAGDLVRSFPDAKFVHLYRDGRETALSMSRHAPARLYLSRGILFTRLGHEPFGADGPNDNGTLPAELGRLVPDRRMSSSLEELPFSLERFGRLWSTMILRGARRLAALPPENVMHLSYERLVTDGPAQLTRLAEFFELPGTPPSWAEDASRRVRARPPAWQALPEDEQRRLERACEPGERRLRRLGAA